LKNLTFGILPASQGRAEEAGFSGEVKGKDACEPRRATWPELNLVSVA